MEKQGKFEVLKAIISVIILFIVFGMLVNYLDNSYGEQINNTSKRKYEVRLSNWVGSDYYHCDSVAWINEHRIKLFNNGDKKPFITISVPDNVILRIYPNK